MGIYVVLGLNPFFVETIEYTSGFSVPAVFRVTSPPLRGHDWQCRTNS